MFLLNEYCFHYTNQPPHVQRENASKYYFSNKLITSLDKLHMSLRHLKINNQHSKDIINGIFLTHGIESKLESMAVNRKQI